MTTGEIIAMVVPSATALLTAGVILGSFKAVKEDVKEVKRMTLDNTIAIARMQGADDTHVQANQVHLFPPSRKGH